jgi:hypothetical protein
MRHDIFTITPEYLPNIHAASAECRRAASVRSERRGGQPCGNVGRKPRPEKLADYRGPKACQ